MPNHPQILGRRYPAIPIDANANTVPIRGHAGTLLAAAQTIFGAFIFLIATIAHGSTCSNVDCQSVRDVCFAALDLDPVTCGLYYGCGCNKEPGLGGTCEDSCAPGCPNEGEGCVSSGLTVGPSQITTEKSPGAASAGLLCTLAATDIQGQVSYNWWNIGQGGRGWIQLGGNPRLTSAPAAALAGTYLFVMATSTDGYVYLNQGAVSKSFVGWRRTDLKSSVAPSAAASGTNVAMLATDSQGHVRYTWWQLGEGSHPAQDLGSGVITNASPAAALVKNYMFVAVKGRDDKLYLNQGTLGKPFVGWQPMNFDTAVAPGAASAGTTTVIVAVDKTGHVFYNWWALGKAGNWMPVGDGMSTKVAPSAALVGNYLFVAITGADGKVHLNQGTLGEKFVGWQ